ncbi:hypothetical protein [Bradyrhizobium cenepequi]
MTDFADRYRAARRRISNHLAAEIVSRNSVNDEANALFRPDGESDTEFVRRIVATYLALQDRQ